MGLTLARYERSVLHMETTYEITAVKYDGHQEDGFPVEVDRQVSRQVLEAETVSEAADHFQALLDSPSGVFGGGWKVLRARIVK